MTTNNIDPLPYVNPNGDDKGMRYSYPIRFLDTGVSQFSPREYFSQDIRDYQ